MPLKHTKVSWKETLVKADTSIRRGENIHATRIPRAVLSLPLQLLNLRSQAGISPQQISEIANMNSPSSDVSCV